MVTTSMAGTCCTTAIGIEKERPSPRSADTSPSPGSTNRSPTRWLGANTSDSRPSTASGSRTWTDPLAEKSLRPSSASPFAAR